MNYLRTIFQFYIYSNLHVSIAVWSFVLITGVYFETNTCKTALFVSIATFVAYNWIRFLKFKNNNLKPHIFEWFVVHKKLLLLLNSVAVVLLMVLIQQFNRISIGVLVPFSLLSVFYMLPKHIFIRYSFSLRNIPSLKIFCIAISWSGMVVLFPMVASDITIGWEVSMFFILQCIFVLVLTLPFDVRDMNHDKMRLRTIPQVLGEVKTKYLGLLLVLIYCIISFTMFDGELLFVMLGMALLVSIFLLRSSKSQSKYYASFWVESIPILWLCILRLLSL